MSETRRSIGLAAVLLLFGIGFAAVLSHPTPERVSFDAVVEIWSSLFRDVDRIGLMITQLGPEEEVKIGQAIDREISREFGSSEPRRAARTSTMSARRWRGMPIGKRFLTISRWWTLPASMHSPFPAVGST